MIEQNNPLISTGENVNLSAELQKTENEIFVNNIIEKANQQIGAKISRKKKEKVVDEKGKIIHKNETDVSVCQSVYKLIFLKQMGQL